MTQRARIVTVAVLATIVLLAAGAYVAVARINQQAEVASALKQTTVDPTTVQKQPRIVFRNSALGAQYGMVAMVPLSDVGGPRAITTTACDRVFAAGGKTLCLSSERGLATTYAANVITDSTGAAQNIPLTGSPSRARLSDDGRFAATTSFVAGDSYAATNFSTRTVVTDLTKGTSQDLEDFTLVDKGQKISPVDRNYWGVTFAPDDDHFFVTVAYGGATHLAKGQLSTRSVETMRTDAECPSLSPDGTRVAYKKRGDRARGDWRLAVLDLKTGAEAQLPEARSVDDQVEWLDDSQILYGMPGEGTKAAESNVWVVNADGTGQPTMLIAQAWSPAVVR